MSTQPKMIELDWINCVMYDVMFNAGPLLPGLRELAMLIQFMLIRRVTVSWGAFVDSGWLAAWGT